MPQLEYSLRTIDFGKAMELKLLRRRNRLIEGLVEQRINAGSKIDQVEETPAQLCFWRYGILPVTRGVILFHLTRPERSPSQRVQFLSCCTRH